MEAEPKLQGQPVQQELIEVHQHKSDSTHQQAVETCRVYSSVASSIANISAEDLALCRYVVSAEQHQSKASAIKTVGVLQPVGPVVEGIGAEPCGFTSST